VAGGKGGMGERGKNRDHEPSAQRAICLSAKLQGAGSRVDDARRI